jgi:hypothetical protein
MHFLLWWGIEKSVIVSIGIGNPDID